ncbi:MAG: tetratricopeptide repeat protein, partial [Bacteroidota bacterium]
NEEPKTVTDNEELKALAEADQADREPEKIDWVIVNNRDEERQKRVTEMLKEGVVRTAEDYANAAIIFQHGQDTTASRLAVAMMRKAIELDSTRDKWLLAAAIDRDLMRRDLPQIYGTQFRRNDIGEPWYRYKIDTTQVTDEERLEYGVETLAQQLEKERLMNTTSLMELFQSGVTVDSMLQLIPKEDLQTSKYNLSEMGLNNFGYQLMGLEKDVDALKIFRLNTELYPEAFNTYDSYGECLLKMGKKEEAFAAYQKSLDLNPNNNNAARILEEERK